MKTIHVIFLTMADMDHYRAYRILPRINVFSKDMTFDIARYTAAASAAEAGPPPATLKFKAVGESYANLDFYMTSMAAKASLYTPLPYTRNFLIAILQKELDFHEYYCSKYCREPSRHGRVFNIFMEWHDGKITEFPIATQFHKPKRMFVVVEGWQSLAFRNNKLGTC